MTARILTALCISLALSGANAQTTPAAAQPPKPASGEEAKPTVRETPPDQKAFAEVVAGLLADKDACRALGRQAREYAESWASIRMAQRVAALYASLQESARPGA